MSGVLQLIWTIIVSEMEEIVANKNVAKQA